MYLSIKDSPPPLYFGIPVSSGSLISDRNQWAFQQATSCRSKKFLKSSWLRLFINSSDFLFVLHPEFYHTLIKIYIAFGSLLTLCIAAPWDGLLKCKNSMKIRQRLVMWLEFGGWLIILFPSSLEDLSSLSVVVLISIVLISQSRWKFYSWTVPVFFYFLFY